MAKQSSYDDHNWVLRQLEVMQEADKDNRDRARKAHLFIDEPDGQWDPNVVQQMTGKPRFTFDMVDSIVDQVAGDLEGNDYDIKISPSGGNSTKSIAKTYDGIIRNIENISAAINTYNFASRNVVTAGLDGWRVVQKYVDDNSFDQDLIIDPLPNYLDRVWHGPHQLPDASDAEYCWVVTWLDKESYEAQYPDRPEASLSSESSVPQYWESQDMVGVGEFYFLKEVNRELVKMTNGDVYEVDESFEALKDELAEAGITEESRRKRAKRVVHVRKFDAKGWIEEAKETVFQNWVPVVPMYGNFKVAQNVIKYRGVVQKLMDPQRVFNYAKSREIEEGALAPREKILATPAQAEGFEEEWAALNTSTDPVMFYNADPDAPGPPTKILGAQVNQGLAVLSQSMREMIGMQAGKFAASMGDNPGLQSGVAIEALQDKGDVANNKYVLAREIAQEQTARILVNAIPRVYTPGRQVRLLKEDGAYDMATIGQQAINRQTGQLEILHDLSVGTYDVNCNSGPSFKNRQNETVKALTEIGSIDPTIMELSSDILLSNISAPGMEQVAKRKRKQAFMAGLIDDEDLTPEELQTKEQMDQQPPQEDPMMVAARAEEIKGQAEMQDAQNKQMEIQGNFQIKAEELKIKAKEMEVRAFEAETDRYKAQIAAEEAKANIQGKGASAAKSLAEAEAQDIENTAILSGIDKILKMGTPNG